MQNNDALSALLNEAGKKTGVNPATLKQNVQNGKLDALLANMKPQDAKRFQEILNNPALAKQLLNTPGAQKLIRRFAEQGGNTDGGLG